MAQFQYRTYFKNDLKNICNLHARELNILLVYVIILVDAMRNCFLLSVKDLMMKAKTHQSISAEIFFGFTAFL